jgi:hypothetical protein
VTTKLSSLSCLLTRQLQEPVTEFANCINLKLKEMAWICRREMLKYKISHCTGEADKHKFIIIMTIKKYCNCVLTQLFTLIQFYVERVRTKRSLFSRLRHEAWNLKFSNTTIPTASKSEGQALKSLYRLLTNGAPKSAVSRIKCTVLE